MSRVLPSVGDEILLAVPHTELVLARVEADGPGFFDLALLERPFTPQPQLQRTPLMIEFINDDGISRLHGRLDVPQPGRGTGRPPEPSNTVRFAHRGSPQLLRRREFVRATVDLPLTLTSGDADDAVVCASAQALDLSGGGMLVRGLTAPVVGTELGFALELGDDAEPVRGRCCVRRLDGADRIGLQFTDLDQDDRVRLMHLAFSMSRDQRRRMA